MFQFLRRDAAVHVKDAAAAAVSARLLIRRIYVSPSLAAWQLTDVSPPFRPHIAKHTQQPLQAAAPCTALSAAWTGAEQAAWTPGSSFVHSPVGDTSRWWENIREKRKICWRGPGIKCRLKVPACSCILSNAVRETCHHSRCDVGKQ